MRTDSGGFATTYFQLPPGLVSTASITFQFSRGLGAGSVTISVDKVSQWTALPFIGTARQKALSLIPGGAVRTQGSIQVSHATSALGKVIVYTHPTGTGYLPPLRPWRVSGGVTPTADATLLSGYKEDIAVPGVTYNVPVPNLPRGRCEVWAWVNITPAASGYIDWTVDSWINSNKVGADFTYFTAFNNAPSGWTLLCLGSVVIPPADIGPAGYVRVNIRRGATTSATILLDEAYLFATDLGNLTVVDVGTGTLAAGGPSNRLWIDAPSQDQPMGGIYRGNAADRSDNWHCGHLLQAVADHQFDPAGTNVFVASHGPTDAATSLTHYRRYFTHVARED